MVKPFEVPPVTASRTPAFNCAHCPAVPLLTSTVPAALRARAVSIVPFASPLDVQPCIVVLPVERRAGLLTRLQLPPDAKPTPLDGNPNPAAALLIKE